MTDEKPPDEPGEDDDAPEEKAAEKKEQRCACGRATSCTSAHGSHLVRIRVPKRKKDSD